MVKISYLVEKRADLADEEFVRHWTTTHAGLAVRMDGLRAYAINLPSAEQRGPRPVDGYAVLHFDSREEAKRAWETTAGRATAEDGTLFMAAARPLIVDEIVVLAPERPPGFKVTYLVTRLAPLAGDDLVAHWRTTHARLALGLPGWRAYSINLPAPEQRGPRPFDGYAVLHFDSRDAAKAAWASEAGRATAQDGTFFMAAAQPVVLDERVVVGAAEEPPRAR
jgi:uncharacterized protein (TIGR02118 family)